jgi:hypothetical protein
MHGQAALRYSLISPVTVFRRLIWASSASWTRRLSMRDPAVLWPRRVCHSYGRATIGCERGISLVRDSFLQSVRTLMAESAPPERVRPVLSLLNRAEADDPGEVTLAEQRPARSEVANLLAVEVGTALVLRQRVIVREDTPVVFVSLWLPPELALATGMDRVEPLGESLRELAASAGQSLRNVTERLTSRLPTSAESAGLAISRRTPVLGLLATVMDASDRPVLALDLAFPGDLHEVTDSYTV